MAGLPAAAKAHAPGLAMGLGVPMAGAQLMGTNEEGSDWKDLVGMGMMTLPMALPLGMAAARKMKGSFQEIKEIPQATKDYTGAASKAECRSNLKCAATLRSSAGRSSLAGAGSSWS